MKALVRIVENKSYLCTTEQTVWAKAYASALDLRLNAPSRGNQSYRTNRPGLRMSSMTAVSTKAVGCETCVYWFSMAFTTLSTVSAYEEEKCLVRSGKDISPHTLPSISTYFAKYPDILCQVSRHTEMSSQMAVCEKKKEGGRFLFFLPLVTRLGLEPKTPTLKVWCSTNWASESASYANLLH